jgi:hypothetical protein
MKNVKQRIPSYLLALTVLMIWTGLETGAVAYEGKSNDANNVRVDVVPGQLRTGQGVKFEIRMNTHSVPLTQDLVAVSLLKDNQGREYHALGWSGSPPGGHHRSGTLEFSSLAKGAQSVTLYIKDIAAVPERIFTWKVE